jgi:TatD DNase family protein
MVRWIDDHCHLELDPVRAAAQVAAAAEAGVERMITVGCDVAQSAAYIDAARRHPGAVWATAGVHPHDADDGIGGLEPLLVEPEVVAVGECGLDFF